MPRFLEYSTEVVAVVDQEATIRFVSASARRVLGYPPEELVGKRLTDYIHPEDLSQSSHILRYSAENEGTADCAEFRFRYRDGSWRFLEVVGQSLVIEGRVYGVINCRDVTDRKRAEETLTENQAQLASIVGSTLDAVVTVDANQRIVLFNAAAEQMFGRPAAAAIGQPLDLILPGRFRDPHRQLVDSFGRTKSTTRTVGHLGVLFGLKASGEEFPVEISISQAQVRGQKVYTAIVRDITERVRAQEALQQSEQRYRYLFEDNPQPMWVYDLETLAFLEVNEAAVRRYGYTRDEFLAMTIRDIRPPEDVPALLENVAAGAAPLDAAGTWRHRLKDGTIVDVEIVSHSMTFGERRARLVLANDVTARKRAEAEVRRRADEFAALYETARDLATVQDPPSLLRTVVERATELLGVATGSILLHDPFRQDLEIVVAKGASLAVGGRFQIGEGLAGRVAQTREPVIVNNYQTWEHRSPQAHEALAAFALGVPMLYGGQLTGVLTVATADSTRPFTDADARLLALFANQAAVALENGRLFDETTRRLNQIRSLHVVDLAIGGSLDLHFTLDVFLEQAVNQLDIHAADVLVLEPHTQTLEFVAGRGFHTKALGQTRLRLGDGYAGRAALERRTISIPNLNETEYTFRRSPFFEQEQFVSYYAVPLKAKGQVKGVLEIFHRAPLRPTEEWLEFMETLAGEAALAIDNARLFNQLERSNSELALAYDTTIEGWSRALDLRDRETEGHTQRVAELALQLGRALGVSETELGHMRRGALLHDIGKMGIPDSILLKPGPLTAEEWEIMRSHPEHAYRILSPISYLRPALDIPCFHHERWNGEGYPRGMVGEEIPLAARIFAVVDVWDALLSARPYREAWEKPRVREYIRSRSGVDFDPKVVDVFFELLDSMATG